MNTSASKRRPSFITDVEEEHEILEPTSKLPLYMALDRGRQEEHKIVVGIYKRPQLKGPYDSNIVNEILVQSDRYKKLKPQVVFQILGKRRKYGYLKTYAFSRLEANLKEQYTIFSQMIDVRKEMSDDVRPSDEFSHSIFSWKWSDFLKRRRLQNFVWVDILLRTGENSLHMYKFQKDLEELQSFLEKIFDVLFSNISEENVDIYQHIEKPIDEAKKALHTTDYVEDEFYINYKKLKNFRYKEYFFINAKRNSEDTLLKTYLENRIWNSHIWDPIEIRYQINWFNTIIEQNQYHMDGTVDKYEAGVAHYKQMLEMEKFVDGNCMDYCYSSIEMYKNRIIEIQDKFDKSFDEVENKLTDIRLQTDKLREQRKWLSNEIERFHEEGEQMRLRIAAENVKEEHQKLNKSNQLIAKQEMRKKSKNKRR